MRLDPKEKPMDDRSEQVWQNLHNALERTASERDRYRATLETLYAVVGLTAFKHESQRAVLQEAMDQAASTLYPTA
jgi:hypothetical protein